jgi:lysophospholipase L1-like esterase
MLGRRRFFASFGGVAALLAGCGPSTEAPPAVAALPRLANALEPTGDPALEATLPRQVGNDPYAPLGAALRGIARGQDARALVMILGDSHSAGPVLSERLRELFQGQFGAVGPGRYAPGRAQRFFNPNAVQLSQGGEWTARNALRSTTPGPFGLTGYRLSGERAGDWISLRSNDPAGFDRLHLTLNFSPEGGSFRFRLDGQPSEPGSTRHAVPGPHTFRIDVPPRSREIGIELTGDGPVEVLGLGVDRRGRGVLVEAFGINGATINTLDFRDQGLLARELAAMPPALLILEFGTNEATDRDIEATGYAATLARHVARLKRMLPRTGLMLMGAPDAGRPSRARGAACGGRLTPLPALEAVQHAQRRVAEAERIGYFDWAGEVTQGLCRVPSLAAGGAPLMRPDLIHFTPDGYRLTADRLFAQILRGAGIEPRQTAA